MKKNKKNFVVLIISFLLLVGSIYFLINNFDDKYTICFDSNGGSVYSDIEAKNGDIINLPKPVKEGYHFVGWKDENHQYVENEYTVLKDTKLKAYYVLEFKITFVYNNGEENTSSNVLLNQNVIEPTIPIKAGYKFDGWYYNDIKYNFDSLVSSNMVLEARWSKK